MPLLTQIDSVNASILPYDLAIRFYMEEHKDAAVYAVKPEPLISQNKSFASDISTWPGTM